jgi:hypothetical protein
MEVAADSKTPIKAFVFLILQVIAWLLILTYFIEDYSTGTDAAGAGMARGFAVFLLLYHVWLLYFLLLFTF